MGQVGAPRTNTRTVPNRHPAWRGCDSLDRDKVAHEAGDLLAGRRVPHSCCLAQRRRDDATPVRAERSDRDKVTMARGWRPPSLATAAHTRAVLSPDAVTTRAIGTKRSAQNSGTVAIEAGDLLAGRRVPHPRRVVLRRRDDATPIGAERSAQNSGTVAVEARDRLSGQRSAQNRSSRQVSRIREEADNALRPKVATPMPRRSLSRQRKIRQIELGHA
jgi:hypothetical protein